MSTLQDIFFHIQETKKKQREIRALYREALQKSHDHEEIARELRALKEKKRIVEEKIKAEFSHELDTLDELSEEIKGDNEKIADMVMSHLMKGEVVKVHDSKNSTYDPILKVVFRKSDDQEIAK